MHRLLTLTALGGAASLTGCWHEAFHTSIQNATGQPIGVTIRFAGHDAPPAHGVLGPGGAVDLRQPIARIAMVEYRVNGRACRLDRQRIASSSSVTGGGAMRVTLHDCGKVDPTSPQRRHMRP